MGTLSDGFGTDAEWMDSSMAELELIESCLSKTSRLTERLSAMLQSFDGRLVKLESTILPLHRSTQSLTILNDNIQTMRQACDRILKYHDSADQEEAIIRRGIGSGASGQVEGYIASLARLREGVDFLGRSDLKGNERAIIRMTQLIKMGLLQLQGAFRATLEPHCTPIEALTVMSKRQRFSTIGAPAIKDLTSLLSLISSQDALSHEGSTTQMATSLLPFQSACQTYRELRSSYLSTSLANLSRASVSTTEHRSGTLENGFYKKGTCGIISYAEAVLGMFEAENDNCQLIFGRLEPKSLARSMFDDSVRTPLGNFIDTCREVNAVIKRQLNPPAIMPQMPPLGGAPGPLSPPITSMRPADLGAGLLALDIRSSLEATIGALKVLIPTDESLDQIMHAIRGTCLSVLAETIEDAASIAVRKQNIGPPSDAAADDSVDRMIYHLEGLLLYKSSVQGLLEIMGESTWSAKAQKTAMGRHDRSGPVEQFIGDTLSTLIRSLDTRSKSFRRPLIGSVHMMNNIVLMMKRIKNGALFIVLGEDTMEYLEKLVLSYQGNYLDLWKPAVEPLMDVTYVRSGTLTTKLGNLSERQATKDRFRMFNEAMDEILRAHQGLKIKDETTRSMIVRSLEKMVGVMFARFLERHQNEPFTKNPGKYLRYNKTTMDQCFAVLFTGRETMIPM